MKYKLLALLFISVIQLEAQTEFVSFSDCKKSTEYIALEKPEHIEKYIKKSKKYVNCVGLKVDTRLMTKKSITDFLIFLQTQTEIKTLELRYSSNDSIDFNALAYLTELESLGLQNPSCNYPSKDHLNGLKKLYKLTLYINQLNQIPTTIYQLNTLGELDLCSETVPTKDPSYLYFQYALNDTLDNAIEINSYCENIDLSVDSVKQAFFALWPKAEERKGQSYVGLNPNNRFAFGYPNPIEQYKENPNLIPIIKGDKSSFEKITINPESDNTIVCKDKTILDIPTDAFMNSAGQSITGNVNLLYRAIRTPADILSSGITMWYDTAGKTEMFKTNGMFELRAFANSEELQLKPGKKIGVNFQSNGDTSKFNFYKLNEKNGKWEYDKNLFMYSTNFNPGNNRMNLWTMIDKTEFADRYSDLSYQYLLPKNTYTYIKVPILSMRRQHANELFKWYSAFKSKKIKPGKSLLRLKTDYEKSNSKSRKVVFYLYNSQLMPESPVGEFFPELKPFDGFAFEYDGLMKTSEFSKLYKRGKCYTDCRIYYNGNADFATIELKTSTGFVEIQVKTLITNSKGKTRPNNGFKKAYNKYLRLLKIKEIKFNQTVSKTLPSYSNINSSIYTAVFANTNATGQTSTYNINISLLGFFNCDQLYRIQQPMYVVNTKFMYGDSLLDNLDQAYIVDKKAQGTYTFNPKYLMLSYDNMGGLVLKNIKGEIFTCTASEFRNQIKSEKQVENQIIKVQKMAASTGSDVVSKLTP